MSHRLQPTIGFPVASLELVYSRDDEPVRVLPSRANYYPELRYMGSKRRLLPWIFGVLDKLDFETAADPFVGSGCVAYLFKCMGRSVAASDFLNFPATLASATIENDSHRLDERALESLLAPVKDGPTFIEKTFSGIFYTLEDLRFLDRVSHNIESLEEPQKQNLARAALLRSCLKKQPRGVFTVGGHRYDDGRRDLKLSMEEHFLEQAAEFNGIVFDNGRKHSVRRSDVFDLDPSGVDLVYLDPPYVPRADDNCYVKRYHFLEGLSCYWRGLEIMQDSKVKKIPKRFTPFSYRHSAIDAFDRLFHLYRRSTIVLSYSSNGYPDRSALEALLARYKKRVEIFEKAHRYHFGTHQGVERSQVHEYLLVGH